jgi:hypothetical protein
MKKLAIGCGLALIVLLVAGGIATWVVVNKVKETVGEFAVLGEIPEIERQVRNTAPYAPPGNGELSADQVSRYVRVQEHVRRELGARVDALNQQYKDLSDRLNRDEGSVLDMPQMIAAYRDLARTFVDAKRMQVQALNDANFSLEEYDWVRRQVYAAAGLPFVDMDVSAFIQDLQQGEVSPEAGRAHVDGALEPAGPESNRDLVEPHRKLLEDNAALAFFGL